MLIYHTTNFLNRNIVWPNYNHKICHSEISIIGHQTLIITKFSWIIWVRLKYFLINISLLVIMKSNYYNNDTDNIDSNFDVND